MRRDLSAVALSGVFVYARGGHVLISVSRVQFNCVERQPTTIERQVEQSVDRLSMSLPNRPAYQKPAKSSSSSSSSSTSAAGGGGGALGARWNGNHSAGVSPVRGLSPVRGTFHGVGGRQDMEMGRSHNNPLFNNRTSEIGRAGVHTTPTKACRECKENREKLHEPWKVSSDKAQYSVKTPNASTPTGKSSRTTATMRFTTPPKPVVKRKILAENREFSTTPCQPTRMKEEEIKSQSVAAAAGAPPLPRQEVFSGSEPFVVVANSQSRNEDIRSRAESDGVSLSAFSPEKSSTAATEGNPGNPKSPLVSIDELQKRIQKFLQDEGGTSAATAGDLSNPTMLCSPRQSNESLRRSLSGSFTAAGCGEESGISLQGFVDEAPFQPVVAPYSPRPEYLRARKSPSMEGNVVSPLRGEADSLIQETSTTATTPKSTYDPKNNFLSPRPQFLRYRPLRRLELLRKSAEGTLGDLDLESPATDAGSSRIGSEKDVDEREIDENESQDVSQQEVQSLTSSSSFESPPPRCKVSSRELFKSAPVTAENGESVTREESEQQQSCISSMKLPPEPGATSCLDVHPIDSKFDYLKEEEHQQVEEEDAEDLDDDVTTSWSCEAFRIVTAFAFIALLVVASGSPALLPTSLHQNRISHLWKTSQVTEPIRQFLQNTEGLWSENSHLARDFSLSFPHDVRVGCAHVYIWIQSHVDFVEIVRTGKVVWSSCMEHSARFGRHLKEIYANLKAWLEGEINFDSAGNGEEHLNEWDWVPEYDFVVPHDMFDPREAYENILARLESSEVKSFWTSVVNFYAKHASGKQIVEEPFVSTIEGRNASLCSLSSPDSDQHDVILSFRLPAAALDRAAANIPISKPCHDNIEASSNTLEQSEVENTPHEPSVVQLIQNVHQETHLSSVVGTTLSSNSNLGIAAEDSPDAIAEVEFPVPPTGELITPFQAVYGDELSHDASEKVQLDARVTEDDPRLLEPVMSQEDQPVSFQESLQGDRAAEAVAVSSNSEENDVGSSMSWAGKPTIPRSLFLNELMMQAPGFRTTAAIFASLLLAAGVALFVFNKMQTRSGNSRTGASMKEPAQAFSKSSLDTQFLDINELNPVEGSTGREFLAEDESLVVQLSFDQVRQFSTPYPATGGTPHQLLGKGLGRDSSQISLKPVTGTADKFQPPNVERTDESTSLGLFTTLVPVVHNEGTARERVQLTPVRRSSRIRTRMQNSPCHSMHSPHGCNC